MANTLLSIGNSLHKDFNVIIVDDASGDNISLPDVSFPVELIKIKDKYWKNNDVACNTALLAALAHSPDIIIMQNAECKHFGDVITYAAENTTSSNYIPFSCFSLDEHNTFNASCDIPNLIESNKRGVNWDGELGWYNHPVYRNVGYEFCAAITANNIIAINGYDERFMDGWGYGDNYLKYRIQLLGLKFETPESPFVIHQWHYSGISYSPEKNALIRRNKELYAELMGNKEIKAEHLITKNF